MKKETLKLLSVLMVLALLLSAMAGCGLAASDGDSKTKEDKETTGSVEGTEDKEEDPTADATEEATTEAPATSEPEDIEIIIEDGADGEVIEEETDGDEIPETETSGDEEEPV